MHDQLAPDHSFEDPFLTHHGGVSRPTSSPTARSHFHSNAQSFTSLSEMHDADETEGQVVVHVYDLGTSFVTRGVVNQVTKKYGAYHTGVEVYGREWSFGMTFDDSTGITWNSPCKNRDHSYREGLMMGYTPFSRREVGHFIAEMQKTWLGSSYHLLKRNCHYFSSALCKKLRVPPPPRWINDLAHSSAATVDYLDSADSGYDGGAALSSLYDSVKQSVLGIFSADAERERYRHECEGQRRAAEAAVSSTSMGRRLVTASGLGDLWPHEELNLPPEGPAGDTEGAHPQLGWSSSRARCHDDVDQPVLTDDSHYSTDWYQR
mmetsp:Transcript_65164/g.172648  ORF Transcript_65164/g.172648 Transcript_65164/m.172648 type:complete len:320 (-) Transcript_65164:147-1106(-)